MPRGLDTGRQSADAITWFPVRASATFPVALQTPLLTARCSYLPVAPRLLSIKGPFTGDIEMNIPRRSSPNFHASDLNRAHIRERGAKNRTDKTSSNGPIALRMRQRVAPYAGVDSELVQQAIACDPVAQEQLYRMCTPKLYRSAFAVLRNKEDAEDAVQDTWFRAYNHMKSFQGRSSFSTWMTRIVLNSALMILRKKRSEREASGYDLGEAETNSVNLQRCDISDNPELIYGKQQRRSLLGLAVASLSPRLRRVLQTGQLRELSLKETARVLGISVNAVKAQLFLARAALRKSAVLKAITPSEDRARNVNR